MKKLIALIAMIAATSAFAADPVPGTGTATGTMTGDYKNDINVTAISNMGGKSSPPPIPGAVVQSQFAGLFSGPSPDIETLTVPLDTVLGHYCTGAIPADVNTRLHKSDDEEGESGKTRIVWEPRTANFATYAGDNRRSSVYPIDLVRFDNSGRMIVYGGDREVYCMGILNGKATIADTDKTLNQTIENDAVTYLRKRGKYSEYLMVSVGLLTRTAPVAVYSTGTSWGLSAGGSGVAETIARFFGISAGGSKNVGITGSTARPEQRFYVFVDCTGKEDAQCARMRADKAPSFKLSAFGEQVTSLFNPQRVQGSPETDAKIDKVVKTQDQIIVAMQSMAGSGKALEERVAQIEKCTSCNAPVAPKVQAPAPKPAAKPAVKAAPKLAAKPAPVATPVTPCDPDALGIQAAQKAATSCLARNRAAGVELKAPAASAPIKK